MRLLLNYFFILIFPIILVLPLPLIFSSVALGLALLNLIVGSLINRKKDKTDRPKCSDLLLLIFGIGILVLDFITNVFRNFEVEFILREVRISFLLVPLILFLAKDQIKPIKIHLLVSLVIGVLGYILYSYGYMIYFYSTIEFRSFEFNHYLIYDLRQNLPGSYHHTYLGMYMTFAIAILLSQVVKKYYWYRIALASLMTLNQVLIGSKTTFLLSILILITFLYQEIKRTNLLSNAILIFVTLITAGGILVSKLEFLNTTSFSASNRLDSWKCAIQGFLKKPLFGHGHENSVRFLENCISSDAISSHNQLLEELLNYGFFGFWLVIFFGVIFIKSWSDKLFKYFVFIVVAISFFENILSLQRGVLFVSFFLSFFYVTKINMKTENSIG